ncbi:MAG: radical SAM protein [Planctomycetaceae bacterium]|nr:radical SAM protein [Planctomycetaceae bacterium]
MTATKGEGRADAANREIDASTPQRIAANRRLGIEVRSRRTVPADAFRGIKRVLAALRKDITSLSPVARRRTDRAQLRAYRVRLPGGLRRFHLRTSVNGDAVLLVDATDAIHLNATAALLTRLALERVPVDRAAAKVREHFRGVDMAEAHRAAGKVYAMIDQLRAGFDSCPCCAARGLAETKEPPPFSVAVTAPYKADLALSYGCNNACPHCYNTCVRPAPTLASPHSSLPSPLRPSQWRQVLRTLAAIGIPHVVFTGGEPTLFEGLYKLIRDAEELGLVSGLNTNGRRLAELDFAVALRRAGLDHVQITLQSSDAAVHNAMSGAEAFDETVAGVRNALAAGLHTITNTTLTRRNVEHAGTIVDFLHHLGVRTFAMNGMIFSGGGRTSGDALPTESLAPVLAQVRERAAQRGMRFLWYTPTEYCRLSPLELELGARRCNAGEYSICIEPNGDVLPCQSYYVPAGNILRDPWERIWHGKLFRSFRERTLDPRAAGLPERCWSCQDLPLCGGGCRIERENT